MFTGLIEGIGEVAEVKPTPAGFRLRLHTDLAPALAPGESLAVKGKLDIEGWPSEMFLDGNQIAVFSSIWTTQPDRKSVV